MSKKSKPQATATKPQSDLATFKRLPEETKELMKLKDQNEKTTGSEHVVITRKIVAKTRRQVP